MNENRTTNEKTKEMVVKTMMILEAMGSKATEIHVALLTVLRDMKGIM